MINTYEITKDSFTDLGRGLFYVSLLTPMQGVYLAVSDTQPEAGTLGEVLVAAEAGAPPRYFGSQGVTQQGAELHIWAIAISPRGSTVVVRD
jgi:hypothetical protein